LLEGCEVLNSDLLILQPVLGDSDPKNDLTELELQVLKSIRIINGFVRIQSNQFKSLNFLRNLEIIRANTLEHDKYSLIITSKSLRTLGLTKLKSIENGEIHVKAEALCLHHTIDWAAILHSSNSWTINTLTTVQGCQDQGYKCDSSCAGCWSTGATSCQFCKTFKLDNKCVESCEGVHTNAHGQLNYIYLSDNETRDVTIVMPNARQDVQDLLSTIVTNAKTSRSIKQKA
jgi:hypothetical protein